MHVAAHPLRGVASRASPLALLSAWLAALLVSSLQLPAAAQSSNPSGFFTAVVLSGDGTRGALVGNVVQPLGPTVNSLYTTTTSGASWTYNAVIGTRYFTCLAMSLDGVSIVAGTTGGIFVSRDAGVSWTTAVPDLYWIAVATGGASGSMIVAGRGDNGGLSQSLDYGATWAPIAPRYAGFTAISVTNDGTLIAAVTRSALLVSYDSGVTFSTPLSSSPILVYGVGVSPFSSTIVALPQQGGPNRTAVQTNRVQGGPWTTRLVNFTGPGRYLTSSAAVSGNGSTIALAIINQNIIARSVDGGDSFVLRPAPTWMSAVAMSMDGMTLVAVSGGGAFVYTSIDGGSTWSGGPGGASLPSLKREY